MSLQILDPPCSLDQIIHFNLENLQKFLNFLLLSDKEAYAKLNEITGKMNQIDEINTSIKKNMEKMLDIEEKMTIVDKTILNFNNKFSIIDNKFENTFQVNLYKKL
jgi:hypothetical protein